MFFISFIPRIAVTAKPTMQIAKYQNPKIAIIMIIKTRFNPIQAWIINLFQEQINYRSGCCTNSALDIKMDQMVIYYQVLRALEPVCCKKQQKRFLTSYRFWNRGSRKILNKDWSLMISGITWTHIQSVWNNSGPSEVPYSANQ